MLNILSLFLHMDTALISVIQTYGFWAYHLLFIVIFLETGLVITPFLPGDSLLFSAGALASHGLLSVWIIFIMAACAAILGDTANYWIGRLLGFEVSKSRFIKKEYLERTHDFYDRHGAKTIILARFVPIVRTFAPFIAGIGKMKYSKFISYNIIGAVAWTALMTFAGFFFGNISFIKNNLSLTMIIIVVLSFIPVFIELARKKKNTYSPDSEKSIF